MEMSGCPHAVAIHLLVDLNVRLCEPQSQFACFEWEKHFMPLLGTNPQIVQLLA
jgi:hypothetical protein